MHLLMLEGGFLALIGKVLYVAYAQSISPKPSLFLWLKRECDTLISFSILALSWAFYNSLHFEKQSFIQTNSTTNNTFLNSKCSKVGVCISHSISLDNMPHLGQLHILYKVLPSLCETFLTQVLSCSRRSFLELSLQVAKRVAQCAYYSVPWLDDGRPPTILGQSLSIHLINLNQTPILRHFVDFGRCAIWAFQP